VVHAQKRKKGPDFVPPVFSLKSTTYGGSGTRGFCVPPRVPPDFSLKSRAYEGRGTNTLYINKTIKICFFYI